MARKILLADDSVTAQNMGRKILADAGYEVLTVNNGSAALKRISEQRPDVIVLDVYMPGYSGLEVCQRLKEVGETARIPILLTVGKLEPFKPEEVKRVRADGFIVKPFEASELLSALSKLEDRIVPRSEPSKPGRFARVTAAIEEGRYDKTVAIEEDSSWKNRIAFPSKKKAKDPEAEEPAAYNPVNKDLRTVIENKIAETPIAKTEQARTEESRVDLGALAPAGLPKDVTPEEIAALAAAAARMQGTITEGKVPESKPEAATATTETPVGETEAQKHETKAEIAAASEVVTAPATPNVTFADQMLQEAPETKEAAATTLASAVSGTISQQESESSSARESGPYAASSMPEEPVTMAVAASAGTNSGPARWTAVSVALDPEEAGISLEQEMRKAYAAFAAAESGHAAASIQESPAAPAGASPAVEPIPQSVPASDAPEAARSLSAVASVATDAVSAAAAQLEAVAASYVSSNEPSSPESASTPNDQSVSSAPIETTTPATTGSFESQANSAKFDEGPAQTASTDSRVEEPKESGRPVKSEAATDVTMASANVSSSSETAATPESPVDASEKKNYDPDFAASTAAAWADWRKHTESENPNDIPSVDHASSEDASSRETAVKAVAAGAEHNPTEAVPEDGSDSEISSIVDSVLADLRPKIVQEISRKLGKKK